MIEECTGLQGELHLPDSLTNIDIGAFYNCSGFTGTLVIPAGVTTLGQTNMKGAFGGCTVLKAIVLHGDAAREGFPD
jgi:hypothetical protein